MTLHALDSEAAVPLLDFDVFDHAPWGMYRTTVDGRYLNANPSLARIYGYNSAAQLMAEITDIARQLYVDPAERAGLVRQLQETGAAFGFETRMRRRDGAVIWISQSCRIVHAQDGRQLYLEGTVEDISDRKRTEEALRRSEARYRALFERAPMAMHSIDPGGRLISVSDRWLELLGYDRAEVIGRPVIDFMTQESARYAAGIEIPAFLRTGSAANVPYQFVRKTGEVIDVLLSAVMECDGEGNPLHSLSVIEDQSRQKNAEAARQASEAEAELAHARLRGAIESLSDGFLLWDRNDRLAMVNIDAFRAWLPSSALPFVGLSFHESVQRMMGEFVDAAGREELFVELMSRRHRAVAGEPSDYRLRNGRWVQITRRRTADGGRVTIWRDITDTRRREQELVAARGEAEAANRAKSSFLAQMSHELRTPLNAVIGFTELLLLDSHSLNATQRDYCGYVLAGGRRLLLLVEDVLDFAGLSAGHLSLAIAPIEVAPVIRDVCDLLASTATKEQVALQVEDGGAAVLADPRRLHQVLLNLVSNGIKYNRPDGCVRLSISPGTGGRTRIAVADTGHGIDPDLQPRLFMPFERLSMKHTAIPGTGLGLSLVKQLVEAMAGTVGFASTPGHGSVFWIELPTAG